MFYYLHFAFGELRYWEINRFARGYIANLQQSTNADQVSQIVLLHWMYPSICQGTLKHQRSLVTWLFPCIKQDRSHVSKQHCIGVSRSSPIYMKAEARSGAAVGISLFFPAIQCFQPKFKIPFHWRKLLHLANDLFIDKDSPIPLAFHMLPSEVRYCFMSPSSLVDLQLLKVCPHTEAAKWGFRTTVFWTGWFGFDLDPCELVMEDNRFFSTVLYNSNPCGWMASWESVGKNLFLCPISSPHQIPWRLGPILVLIPS